MEGAFLAVLDDVLELAFSLHPLRHLDEEAYENLF